MHPQRLTRRRSPPSRSQGRSPSPDSRPPGWRRGPLRERYLDRAIRDHDAEQIDGDVFQVYLRVEDQFLVGKSSEAAVAALHELHEAGELSNDDVVVLLFADRGDKYGDIPL